MSSLTESVLIYNENNNEPKKTKSKWYNYVYLCIEKKGDNQYINGFNCYTFTDFNQADTFYKKRFSNEKNRHTMIPVCKWIPNLLHKYYINYSLKKIIWKNNITILKNEKYI
jgi:hypothetical protein